MLVWPYLDYTSGSIGPLAWWYGGSYVFSTFGCRARYYSVQDYPAINQVLDACSSVLPAAATPTGIDRGTSL
jgi:hypothetical protein